MCPSAKIASARECPVCGGGARRFAFPYGTVYNGKEFLYYHCGSCGSTYVSPIPSEADFGRMYSRENYHDLHYREIRVGGQYVRSVEYLKRYAGARRSLLDFGCGNGSFIVAANDKGFRCTGVEAEPSAITNAREKSGLEVIALEDAVSSCRRFDIIHLGDVLEHLAAPVNTVKMLRSLLSRDGIFYIEGPLENHYSLVFFTARSLKAVRRATGNQVLGSSAPTHLFRVNACNQKRFFTDRLGYECVAFHIYETGWPYLSTVRTTPSPSNILKAGIAFVAVSLSNVVRLGQRRIFGNRFRAIVQPPEEA